MKLKLLSLLATLTFAHAGCLPDAPTNLAAYVPIPPPGYVGIQAIRVLVVWGDVRTEKSYTVERAVWNGLDWGPYQLLAVLPRNATAFTDWQPQSPCVYRVSSVNQCGSNPSLFVFAP